MNSYRLPNTQLARTKLILQSAASSLLIVLAAAFLSCPLCHIFGHAVAHNLDGLIRPKFTQMIDGIFNSGQSYLRPLAPSHAAHGMRGSAENPSLLAGVGA